MGRWGRLSRKIYDDRRKEEAREQGLCVNCWIRPAKVGFARCEKCLAFYRNWARQHRNGKRQQDIENFGKYLEQLSEAEKAWMAGIVDGEGYIAICKRRPTKKSIRYFVEIGVTNTDIRILQKVQSLLKGAINENGNKKQKPYYKRCYFWTIRGYKAAKLLTVIAPYLVSKQEKAELAIRLENTKIGHRWQLSEGEIELREQLYQKSKVIPASAEA